MKTKDTRPRFGWCDDIDDVPQHVWEKKGCRGNRRSVVVIPLPGLNAKIKVKVREFVKELNK